jgi:hypothetical protein
MAWIESHQAIERHPKTHMLSALMGWNLDETIGKLHRLWYWALDYAEDGDLRKFPATVLAGVVTHPILDADKLVDALKASRFCDHDPFRLHDWWDYVGRFLQVKYKSNPMKWKKIQRFYHNRCKNPPKNRSKPQDLNRPIPNQPLPTKDTTLPDPNVKVFLDYAFEAFQTHTGEKLCIDGKKDGAIVKRLLGTYGLDRLKGLWGTFLRSDDPFIRTAGWSIGVFKSQINKLLTADHGPPPRPLAKWEQSLMRVRAADAAREKSKQTPNREESHDQDTTVA